MRTKDIALVGLLAFLAGGCVEEGGPDREGQEVIADLGPGEGELESDLGLQVEEDLGLENEEEPDPPDPCVPYTSTVNIEFREPEDGGAGQDVWLRSFHVDPLDCRACTGCGDAWLCVPARVPADPGEAFVGISFGEGLEVQLECFGVGAPGSCWTVPG